LTVTNGTLKLKSNAATSTIIDNTVDLIFNASNVYAGGTFEFVGQASTNNVETMDVLTPTLGAGTIKLTPGSGGTASLVFGSLGTIGDGATVNITGSNGTTNTVTLTGVATGLVAPHFYFGGSQFARSNSGVLVAPVYGTDATFVTAPGAAALPAGQSNFDITGNITAQTSQTVSTLRMAGSRTLTLGAAQTLTVRTGAANTDGGILATGGDSTITGGTGITTGGSGALIIRVDGSLDTLTLSTPITSGTTGGVTKSGAGTLILSATNANTAAQPFSILEGGVQLTGSGGLGAAGTGLTMRQGTTLDLNGVTPANTTGALNNNGTITSSTAATFTVGGSNGTGTSYGLIAGAISLSKIGTGAQSWLGDSTYTGVTNIASTGLVTVDRLADGGQASGIGASTNAASNLVFSGSTGGLVYQGAIVDGLLSLGARSASTNRLFTLSGTGATLSSTAANGNAIVWSNTGAIAHGITGPQTLIFTGTSTGDNTFNPQLTDSGAGANITSVTKQGAGQWNLGNTNNTYTGKTTLNEGILALNDNGALSASSPLELTPTSATSVAVLQMSGEMTRNLAATATAGSGTITFAGTTASTTGGVGFAAHTTPLVVAIGGTGSPTALTWGSGGFVGTSSVQNLVFGSSNSLSSVDFRNAIDLGASQRIVNVLDNTVTGADYAIMSGVLSGTGGSLQKIGSGTLRLSGANTYTGTTNVSAGTLVVTSLGLSTGTGGTSVGQSGVTFDNTNAVTLGNGTTGGGILQYVGAGETSDRKIRLNTTTGSNQIHADGSGPLILTNVANDFATPTGNKTLFLRGSNTAGNMITSVLSNDAGAGTLAVTVDGGATWILSGVNTYSGGTNSNAGSLGIGHNSALGSGGLTLNSGNLFAYGADRTISNTATLANNTTQGFSGDYSLTFSNALVYAASANSTGINNHIAAGKALTFTGMTVNSLTANRSFSVDGIGTTVIDGNISTTTLFGMPLVKTGNGVLQLNGTGGNFTQNNSGIDVDRGTLKLGDNEVIPNPYGAASTATSAAITASAIITVGSTAGLAVGQPFTGTGVAGNATILTIDSPTQFTAAAAQTIASGVTLTFAASGGITLSPEGTETDTATLDLNGKTETITALTATTTGNVVIDNTSATPATLRFGANNAAVNFGTSTGTYTITDSGAGALSIIKAGSTSATFAQSGGTINLTYQGSTTVEGGTLTLAVPVNGTTGLSVLNSGSSLALTGGITNAALITSVVAENGTTLSLLDGNGNKLTSLTNLQLGSTAGTMTTLNLNVGDTTAGDSLRTDTLTLLTGGTLSLFTGNQVTLNLTDIGLNANQTYNLIDVVDGGLTLGNLSVADWILGSTPGGFTSIVLNKTDTLISLTTGNLITGASYWRGLSDNTWNANSTNWSDDKAGTIPSVSIPGQGTDVIFAYDGASGAVATTLEQNFKINSLTFEAGVSTPASVSIAPGVVTTNRLEIAPQLATDGVKLLASGPPSVTISAPFRLGAAQTWNVADSTSVLTLSGGLQGEADVTKTGSGKVTLSAAAAGTFNTGLTTDVTISAGTLELTNAGALGTTAGNNLANVAVNSGAFYYNNATTGTVANPLTLAGGTLSAGGNTQTYSGTVNVSSASTINMSDSNATLTGTARSITLSGLISGTGNLAIDGNNTASAGNQVGGTLTMSNAGNTWSGDLLFNRGTVTVASAASPSFTGNDVAFNGFGRLILQGLNSATLTSTGTLTYAAGAVGEFQVDNSSGSVSAPFTVNWNGAVSLGAGAAMRLFVADGVNTVANFGGAVTLGGNGSISVGGTTGSVAIISGIIGDGGNAFGLAVNNDLGGWATTNQTLRLTGLNTFTGNVSLDAGILEYDTVTNISGGASALGNGTAISTTNAATLRFIGTSAQSTDRPITTAGGALTLSANGATAADTITYNGAITVGPTADGSQIVLTGAAGRSGLITGNITQTGDTADATVNGGTWSLSGASSRIGDVLTVSTGATLNLTGGLLAVRNDFVVTGTGTTLNLNGTGVLSFNTATLSSDASLLLRDGGVVNLGANDAVVATEFDRLFLGQDADGATPTLNMNSFNLTTSRLILGERAATRQGVINGTGTLTTTGGDIDLYKGTINANLGSTGTTALEKFGPGLVTLAGNNSALASTGAAIVYEGTLALDYTSSNTTKLNTAAALDMRGSNLTLTGNNSAGTTQSVASFTTGSGGSNYITLTPGTSQEMVLNLNALTRAVNAQDGTLRLILPTGTQSATNGVTTDTLNTIGTGANAIIGGWLTVNDGTGVFFGRNATGAVDGNIVAANTTSTDAVASWTAGANISDSSGFTGTLSSSAAINSLRFNSATGGTATISSGGILSIQSGGILATSSSAGSPGILGGTLVSGAIASNVPELMFIQSSATAFEVGADIRINHAVTKSGNGILRLNGDNVYTGYTEIQEGTLQVAGGNAIGDTSIVTLSASRNSTLQLLSNETIGRLAGGQRATNSDYGIVAVGSNTLTLNQSASTTYAGFFTGTGSIVMNSGGTGNLNLTNVSTGFTGSVVVSGGLFQLSGIGQIDASSFTINKGGNLLIDNNGTTRSGTRVLDGAPITLNSADGAFSGATAPRGLAIRSDQDATLDETVGVVTANSGASYLTLESTTSNDDSDIIVANLLRANSATLNVRGTNLGGSAAQENEFRIGNSGNETTFIGTLVGGGGAAASQNISIVPWAIGESMTGALATTTMGNSLVTYTAGSGIRPLDFATEYDTIALAAATDNARESLAADLTGLVGTTVNALVINNSNNGAVNIAVTGTGAGQALAITSGALLFTRASTATTATAQITTLSGFDAGITTAGVSPEYVIHVVNPDAGDATKALTASISSPLSSTADITKAGRGVLILSGTNTAGGGTKKTTINEGVLQISDLDNIGGDTGGLVFAGGTLRLGVGFADDLSGRTITLLNGGGILDTNGIDATLAGSVGSGAGSLTKTGAGNLTLNGTATYTGGTVISGGTVTIGATNALGVGGNLTVGAGATLALGTNNLSVGLMTTSGAGPVISGTGTITASSGFFFNNTVDTAVSAVLGGAGGLLKAQTNALTLSGLNTYTDTTEIQAGTVSFNSIANVGGGASALGAPATVEDGVIRMGLSTAATTLTYTGSGHTTDRIVEMQGTTGGVTINADGTGALGLGVITTSTNGNKTLTLQGAATGFDNSVSAVREVGGVLSVTKAGAGTWLINGASNYTGTTTVTLGVLKAGNDNALGTGTISLNGGTLHNNNANRILANAVTLAANSTLDGMGSIDFTGSVSSSGASRTLTINNTGTVTFGDSSADTFTLAENNQARTVILNVAPTAAAVVNATIQNGTGTGADGLTKQGNGSLALTAANTYTGATTISGGTFQIGNGGTTGSLNTTSTITVASGATFAVNRSDTVTQGTEFSGAAISGAGGFTQAGSGSTILNATNTYTGKTSITAGKLVISSEDNLGSNPAAPAADQLTLNGGTLQTTATLTIDDSNRGITVSAASSIETAAGTTATISSTILGGATLSKEGAGTLIFTAVQTGLTGAVTVNGGTLAGLGGTGGDLVVASSGTLSSGVTGTPGAFTVTGSLTVSTGGTLATEIGGATTNAAAAVLAEMNANGNLLSLVGSVPSAWENYLNGTTAHSHTLVSSTAAAPSISGTVALLGAYSPVYGDVFDVLDWGFSGAMTTTPSSFNFGGITLPAGLDFNTDLFASNGLIVVVPEPSRALFLMLGLLGLMLRRRRK
jgi:autotransporter-associated beta strand protein